MAIAIETFAPSKDQKGRLEPEHLIEEFLREQIKFRKFGLLFGLNRDQGVVIDHGLHALPSERMQEIALRVMKEEGGLIEESGQSVPGDYGDLERGEKREEVTVFEGRGVGFERRVCINLGDEPFRNRWFLIPQSETPR